MRGSTPSCRHRGWSLSVAAGPRAFGRALGAVASDVDRRCRPGSRSARPFPKKTIKRTLDNCRLDYVYEPDWPRLLARMSRMLAQGKVVGWFQGPMAFGPRALGTRSILADPSNRYARQNMNEYLRQVPLDEPLPLVVAPSMARRVPGRALPACRCVATRTSGRNGARRSRPRSTGATTSRVHALGPQSTPRLGDLLESHYAATGTPGLIEIEPGRPRRADGVLRRATPCGPCTRPRSTRW